MKNKPQRYAIIGLDGSGKTTNIELLKTEKEFKNYKFIWTRWGISFLNPIYKILTQNKKIKPTDTREEINEKHKKKNKVKSTFFNSFIFKSRIVKYLWLTLVIIDYKIQFYKNTSKSLIKRENIIFDRFYIDIFIDQGINLGYSTKTISNLIKYHKFFFPKITKYIYINVSPETCYKRKADIPNLEYLTRRYEIYKCLSNQKNWIVINGEESLNQVYKNLKQQIN